MTKSSSFLREKKRLGQKIPTLTCYDYPTAVAQQQAGGIDLVLVGDSVGTNVLGYASEQEVTLADIVHHVRAVRRGIVDPYLLADLPYGTYETPDQALANAKILREAGADGVKLEGPRTDVIAHLVANGIEVSAHLGLEPQHHEDKKLQGRTASEAQRILAESEAVAKAGAFMLVLELIPEELAGIISKRIDIPTIGIGAGPLTDGQVLVFNDVVGLTEKSYRHNRRYQEFGQLLRETVARYGHDVASGAFPAPENTFHMKPEELSALEGGNQS